MIYDGLKKSIRLVRHAKIQGLDNQQVGRGLHILHPGLDDMKKLARNFTTEISSF